MQKLSASEIQEKLRHVKGWSLDGDAIRKEWRFKDFSTAMVFINRVAAIAEKHDHHPEIFNVYNRVSLCLYTHDSGGLTQKDFQAAVEIDQL